MKTVSGGTKVGGGFYWDRSAWELTVVPADGGTLPGDATRFFSRVPTLALVLLGPIAGAFYVIAFPFVGAYLLGRNLFKLGARALGRAPEATGRTKKI